MSDFSIRFLTRPGCHLCDEARPLVEWAVRRTGAALVEVDIETDDGLVALYGLRIPVVLAQDDVILAEGVIDDRRMLRRRIRGVIAGQPD